ncbi:MAG: hypothetical protein IJQ82_14215 [Selenomonadaceae bacterium]|nr:hypothetical protein [Selenomonadaceae bacterium]
MNVEKLYSKAVTEFEAKNYNAALKLLDKIKKYAPNNKDALWLEARIEFHSNNSVKAFYALKKILPLLEFSTPEGKNFALEVFLCLINACRKVFLLTETSEFCFLAMQLGFNELKNRAKIIEIAIFSMNASEDYSAEDFRALYHEHQKCLADVVPYPKKFYDHKKIRVGFISADFYFHPVINWSWSLLNKLDKNLFKTYFYSSSKKSDVVTENLRHSAENWRDINNLTDEAAAKLIRDDEIDILFDMSGYTGGARLRVSAYCPASVQICGIGYMNSTGLDCFDYFLSDVYCAGDENFFTEKVIKLPHSHICYEPTIKFIPAAEPPCLKNNFVTFGSFSQFGKVTDSILIAWKKILDAVPNSLLILKHVIFNTDDGKIFVGERMKNLGFDLARIEMRGFSDTWLVEYGDVDIALDTFPYTGGVTTCEALYMGVPVISLYGARHGSRFGLSILKNIGLDELAVDSYDEYINRAVALAGDWELLTILRKNLRPIMKKSPLMNSESYLREIQGAFIKILNDERQKS